MTVVAALSLFSDVNYGHLTHGYLVPPLFTVQSLPEDMTGLNKRH